MFTEPITYRQSGDGRPLPIPFQVVLRPGDLFSPRVVCQVVDQDYAFTPDTADNSGCRWYRIAYRVDHLGISGEIKTTFVIGVDREHVRSVIREAVINRHPELEGVAFK